MSNKKSNKSETSSKDRRSISKFLFQLIIFPFRLGKGALHFVHAVRKEAYNTSWPKFHEVFMFLLVVGVAVILFGLFFYTVDSLIIKFIHLFTN